MDKYKEDHDVLSDLKREALIHNESQRIHSEIIKRKNVHLQKKEDLLREQLYLLAENIDIILLLAPGHNRLSCNDQSLEPYGYVDIEEDFAYKKKNKTPKDVKQYVRCVRCFLLEVKNHNIWDLDWLPKLDIQENIQH